MATELGTAYVSIVAETSKLEAGIKSALEGGGKNADLIGKDIGQRISATASKAMKDGWRPDQDLMAGIPNTKLDQIGARIGQVIGKGVVAGLRARQAGQEFGRSFAEGAGSVGLGSVVSRWKQELSGGGAMRAMGLVAGKALSAGITAGVGAAAAGVGLALTKGFDRLVTLDTAKYKLTSILRAAGKDVSEVGKIVDQVTKVVSGTPFSLDQAFGTAVQAIGAGTKDIGRFMKDVADAAGFAGTDIDRMGLIFNQVQAKGKLTGEEMMQLMEAGLPARSWIQDSYDLTNDQFDKMQKDGELTLDMLQKSIEDHAGGMASAMGNTLQGAMDNMQTSIARVGADFLSAVFGGPSGDPTEGLKGAIQRITEQLNNLDTWVKAHRDDIRAFFENAKDAVGLLITALGRVTQLLSDHPNLIKTAVAAFAAFETIKGIAAVVTALKGINTALQAMPAFAATAVGALAPIARIAGTILAAYQLGQTNPAWTPDATTGSDGSRVYMGPNGVPGYSVGPDGNITIFDNNGNPRGGGGPSTLGGGPNAQRERRGLAPISATDTILGNLTGFPAGVGGGGRGFMNYAAASAYLDRRTMSDAQLLANVPSGRYDNGAVSDLSRGLADCSSSIEDLINIIDGRSTAGREMTTFNAAQWLTSRGFRPGTAPGAFNVGFTNQGTPHMEATLPGGTNFNWGNNTDAARGGRTNSAGAFSPNLTQRFYRYAGGGGVRGAGTGKSDSNLAMLSHGEHVLSASDVNRMGGQSGVYAFRNALHGYAQGGAVGGQKLLEDMRTAGAIPAAAGSTAKAGTSTISQFIDMGGEIVNSVIEQAGQMGAQAAALAAEAGVATSTMGGAAPAAPLAGMAAQHAVQMGTEAAKRGITWGFDMLGIGTDALLQQLTPFGMPRWLNSDLTGFVPQQAITGALGNLMSAGGQEAIPGSVDPNTTQHGTASNPMLGPPDSVSQPGPDTSAGPAPGAVNSLSQPNIDALAGSTLPAGLDQPAFTNSMSSFLSTELAAPQAPPPDQQPMFKVDQIITTDAESVGRELTKRGRLAQMQYANRPGL